MLFLFHQYHKNGIEDLKKASGNTVSLLPNFLEVEPSFRDKINNYVVNTIDKEDKESYKDTSKKVEYKDNIINVAFDKVSK